MIDALHQRDSRSPNSNRRPSRRDGCTRSRTHGLELWTTLALVGGLSAVAVGLGVLTGRSGSASDDDLNGYHDWTTVALTGLALTSVAVGAGIALA